MQALLDFYRSVYVPLKLRGKSLNTQRQYEIQIRKFNRFLIRESTLADFNDETLSSFLGWMRQRGDAAPTANKARNHLLAMWRLAARKHLIQNFPDVPPEVEPERIPQAWMAEDLHKLLEACRAEKGDLAGVPAALWWYTLHLVLWDTGERIGAVLQVRWPNVDLTTGWLIVPAELRKGKLRDKAFPLHPNTVAALGQISTPRRKLVFPWPRAATSIYDYYNRILERAGLPTDRKSKFHRMRKSVASHYEAAGGNAMALLDHSSRKVTEAYIDPRIVKHPSAAQMLFRPD